jgi:hypothetical protein
MNNFATGNYLLHLGRKWFVQKTLKIVFARAALPTNVKCDLTGGNGYRW